MHYLKFWHVSDLLWVNIEENKKYMEIEMVMDHIKDVIYEI